MQRFEGKVVVVTGGGGGIGGATCRRLARDYDMLDDIRSNSEIFQDLVRRAKYGDGDLLKYLQEMIDGNTHEIYVVEVP